LEKEMISLFSNIFKASYFEYLVRSSAQHFTDLVFIAESIEQAIWLGKIADSTEEKDFIRKKKETEVHYIEGGYKGKERTTKIKTPTSHVANFSTSVPRNQSS
jgi:hypothetical protein